MPGDLIPKKPGAFDRLQTTPKDVTIPEGLKTPKRQHSSRFDISEKRELEKLPNFNGMCRPAIGSSNLISTQRYHLQNDRICFFRNWSSATSSSISMTPQPT